MASLVSSLKKDDRNELSKGQGAFGIDALIQEFTSRGLGGQPQLKRALEGVEKPSLPRELQRLGERFRLGQRARVQPIEIERAQKLSDLQAMLSKPPQILPVPSAGVLEGLQGLGQQYPGAGLTDIVQTISGQPGTPGTPGVPGTPEFILEGLNAPLFNTSFYEGAANNPLSPFQFNLDGSPSITYDYSSINSSNYGFPIRYLEPVTQTGTVEPVTTELTNKLFTSNKNGLLNTINFGIAPVDILSTLIGLQSGVINPQDVQSAIESRSGMPENVTEATDNLQKLLGIDLASLFTTAGIGGTPAIPGTEGTPGTPDQTKTLQDLINSLLEGQSPDFQASLPNTSSLQELIDNLSGRISAIQNQPGPSTKVPFLFRREFREDPLSRPGQPQLNFLQRTLQGKPVV